MKSLISEFNINVNILVRNDKNLIFLFETHLCTKVEENLFRGMKNIANYCKVYFEVLRTRTNNIY